jgi:NitT/TauT family transport system substrate-binding protein
MKRILSWSVLLLACPLLLLLGCGKDEGKSTKVPIASFTWVGYAPLHLAKEKGYFEGIDVEIKMIDDTSARRAALSKGDVQASTDILDSFVVARASGVPAKVVLKIDDSMGGDGIVVKKEINSLKDLKGKTVAFAKDQPSHFFLLTLLEREGMSMDDIKPKPMNEADLAGQAFLSGDVDAAVTWEPWLTKAKGKNGKVLVTSKETPGLIVDVFTVRSDFIQKNPDAVKALLKGWFAAIDFWKKNPDEANKIMAKSMKMEPEEFAKLVAGIRYGDREGNKEFFEGGADSKFSKLTRQASGAWKREKLIKEDVDPKVIDGSALVLDLK